MYQLWKYFLSKVGFLSKWIGNSSKLYDIKFKYLIENFEKGLLKNEEEPEETNGEDED